MPVEYNPYTNRWEYKVVYQPLSFKVMSSAADSKDVLEEFSTEGWEVIEANVVLPGTLDILTMKHDFAYVFLLKRPFIDPVLSSAECITGRVDEHGRPIMSTARPTASPSG